MFIKTITSADLTMEDYVQYQTDTGIMPTIKEKIVKAYNRNKNNANNALCKANLECEICKDHKTFKNKNGLTYMEIHHLIPLNHQGEFITSLDVSSNMICLCPMCHRRLHHGCFDEIHDDLVVLFETRISELKKSGIIITLFDLLKMYK